MNINFGVSLSTLSDIALPANMNAQAPTVETLSQVAQSFESLYVQMLLKSMRSVHQVLKSDFSSSQENDTYQDLLDQQLSVALATTQSVGISKLIVKCLGD